MNADKALAAKKKAALTAAKALLGAGVALQRFRSACIDCGDPAPRLDDTRVTLTEKVFEYGNYLNSVFDK